MATKKEKRARGLAKREEFMAKYRAEGLAAQKADQERYARREAEMNEWAQGENRRLREVLDREIKTLRERVARGDLSGLTENDIEYVRAFCQEEHADGSRCEPTFDGYVYICTYALLVESERRQSEEMTEHRLQRVMDLARLHPLIKRSDNAE